MVLKEKEINNAIISLNKLLSVVNSRLGEKSPFSSSLVKIEKSLNFLLKEVQAEPGEEVESLSYIGVKQLRDQVALVQVYLTGYKGVKDYPAIEKLSLNFVINMKKVLQHLPSKEDIERATSFLKKRGA